MKTHVYVTADGYKPIDADDVKEHGKLAQGEIVQFSVKRARFYPLLQKYWACCNMIAQNYRKPEYKYLNDKDKVDVFCRHRAGLVDCTVVMPDVTIVRPASISYSAMDQDDFQAYYDKAIDIMSDISDMPRDDIEKNWHRYKTTVKAV